MIKRTCFPNSFYYGGLYIDLWLKPLFTVLQDVTTYELLLVSEVPLVSISPTTIFLIDVPLVLTLAHQPTVSPRIYCDTVQELGARAMDALKRKRELDALVEKDFILYPPSRPPSRRASLPALLSQPPPSAQAARLRLQSKLHLPLLPRASPYLQESLTPLPLPTD